MQVFVPLMYGRTEAESSGPSEGLEPLSDLAKLLVPRPGDALQEQITAGGDAVKRHEYLAPWAASVGPGQERQRHDILLVQGPAGSGKSLFAWSLYSRFGRALPPPLTRARLQMPRPRQRTR